MTNGLLLWVDDEIEQLRAHLLFLQKKGYEVVTVSNGTDAIEECQQRSFDLVLLDEQMPGLSGLETLQRIKELQPALPVVMVTKSEEENIMEQAIGQKIADYLIKPVNPNQILLTLKKNIHRREIETEVTQSQYQQRFQEIAMQIMDCRTWQEWTDVYRKLVHWELQLSATDSQMTDMLRQQNLVGVDGLDQVVGNLLSDGLLHDVLLLALGHHHHRQRRLQLLDLLQRLQSAETGHLFVEQHHVEVPLTALVDGVGTVRDRHHLVAFLLEEQQVCPQLFYLVVHPK